MPYDITDLNFREKLEVLYLALSVTSPTELMRELTPDRGVMRRMADRIEGWADGTVKAMQNLAFFDLLGKAMPTRGGRPARLFPEEITRMQLALASVEEFTGWLQPPFGNGHGHARGTNGMPAHICAYPNWNKLLEKLDLAAPECAEGQDLRILTTSFRDMPKDKLLELARRRVRIRVILTHPIESVPLIKARHMLRRDGWKAEKEIANAPRQIDDLMSLRELLAEEGFKEGLDVRLSNALPYAFAAIGSALAVLGLFLADRSYSGGPMLVVEGAENGRLLAELRGEWDLRWKDARPVEPGSFTISGGG
jgi:hypothetical protein